MMKKTMICISLIAMMALLASVAAFASDAQEITFGMSMEEVEAIAGRRDWQDQVTSPTAGIYDHYIYSNQKISKFDDAHLRYVFMDNNLIARIYDLDDTRASKYGYLAGALESKYGPSNENYTALGRFLDYDIGIGTVDESMVKGFSEYVEGKLSCWTMEDGTEIVLFYMKYDGDEYTSLGYLAPTDSLSIEYDDSGL